MTVKTEGCIYKKRESIDVPENWIDLWRVGEKDHASSVQYLSKIDVDQTTQTHVATPPQHSDAVQDRSVREGLILLDLLPG